MSGIIMSLKTAAPQAPGGAVRPVTELVQLSEKRTTVAGSSMRPVQKSPGDLGIVEYLYWLLSRTWVMCYGPIIAAGGCR